MDVLELLWQLQNQDYKLSKLKKELERIEEGERIKEIAENIKRIQLRLTDLKFRIEETEKNLNRNNFALKDLDYKLHKTERDLYEGNISDIRQLEYLNKEQDCIRKEIDNKEIEIITQMEEVEALREESISIQASFNKSKIEYKELEREYTELIEKLKQELVKETDKREKIASQINGEIVEIYNRLRQIKGNAMAEIVDYKCSGCNVLLPTIVVDRLKFQNEIVYCENCGRMLFYPG